MKIEVVLKNTACAGSVAAIAVQISVAWPKPSDAALTTAELRAEPESALAYVRKIGNPKLGPRCGQPAAVARGADHRDDSLLGSQLAECMDNAMACEPGRPKDRYHETTSVSKEA